MLDLFGENQLTLLGFSQTIELRFTFDPNFIATPGKFRELNNFG